MVQVKKANGGIRKIRGPRELHLHFIQHNAEQDILSAAGA